MALAAKPGSAAAAVALALTGLGDADIRLFVIAFLAVFLLLVRGWRIALLFVAIVAGGAALVALLKGGIARPRPGLLPHQDVVLSHSLPSGHAANNLIVWLAAARLFRPSPFAAAAALALAFAIGVSRVMLSVHWPSDIVAGWAVGLAWVAGCLGLVRSIRPALMSRTL